MKGVSHGGRRRSIPLQPLTNPSGTLIVGHTIVDGRNIHCGERGARRGRGRGIEMGALRRTRRSVPLGAGSPDG